VEVRFLGLRGVFPDLLSHSQKKSIVYLVPLTWTGLSMKREIQCCLPDENEQSNLVMMRVPVL